MGTIVYNASFKRTSLGLMDQLPAGTRVRYESTLYSIDGGTQRPQGQTGEVIKCIKSRLMVRVRFDSGQLYEAYPHSLTAIPTDPATTAKPTQST